MRVWLTEAEYAFAFFGLFAVLLLVPWVRGQYRRFGRFRGWPAVVSGATILYACALIAFTMFPLPRTTPGYCAQHADRSYWQLTPFASLDDIVLYAEDHTLAQTLTSGVLLQVVMNVVLFVPLGFLLAYRWRRRWLPSILAALGLSLLIELTQGTGLWGLAECPYRLADVDDLLTNTLGGALGWVLGRWLGRHLPDPAPHAVPDVDPPTLGRRALAVLVDLLTYLTVLIGLLVLQEEFAEAPDRGTVPFAVLGLAVSALLFVLIPALVSSRAGPGAAGTALALRAASGGPALRWSLVVRWCLRWLPLVVLGLPGFAVMVTIDALVAWRRSDSRSLSDIASRTVTRTRTSVEQGREDAYRP